MINAAPRLKMGRWHILPCLNCYVHRHVIIAGTGAVGNTLKILRRIEVGVAGIWEAEMM